MNQQPVLQVVDLGDAKVATKGPFGPVVEDHPDLPMREED